MARISRHYSSINISGRYFVLGDLGKSTKHIWFVLHGQGMLAEYFLNKFEPIASNDTCIIAPEALNRYYVAGYSGKVGASWMTSADRGIDIANYLVHLDQVHSDVIRVLDSQAIKITLLGFSQGTATVTRWLTHSKISFTRLIIWGGMLAHDLDFEKAKIALNTVKVIDIQGDEDPFSNEKRIKERSELYKLAGIVPEKITFHGGHEIDKTTLLAISHSG